MHYLVKLPLEDGCRWFTLADCESIDVVCEILKILARPDAIFMSQIQIDVIPGEKRGGSDVSAN